MQTKGSGRATGYVFIVQRKGGPQWFVKYRHPGHGMKQIQRKLGPAWADARGRPLKGRPTDGFLTTKMAEDRLRRLLVEADDGAVSPQFAPTSGRTLGQACTEWLRFLEEEEGRKPNTMVSYRSVVNRHLLPGLGADTPLSRIGRDDINRLRSRLLAGNPPVREDEKGRGPGANPNWKRTAQKAMVSLGSALKLAVENGWIAASPMAGVKSVCVPTTDTYNFLSAEEIEAVVREADAPETAALIRVAACAGLRWGELRALRWEDVDFVRSSLRISRSYGDVAREDGSTKSGKRRTVPLSDQCAAALDGLSRREHFTGPSNRVFVSATGGPLKDNAGRLALYPALDGAGLGDRTGPRPFRFHDLRHTFGTLCASRGVNVVKIQKWMGHADLTTTSKYMHFAPQADDAALLTSVFATGVPVAAAA